MTQSERNRFIILIVLLVLLVGISYAVNRYQRRGEVGASVLGTIANQAVATFKTADGLELTNLSTISELRVSTPSNRLTVNYELGGSRPNQGGKFAIQFYRSDNGQLLTTIPNQKGQPGGQGKGLLRVQAKNIPNAVYDISVKPQYYLSQAKKNIAYFGGQTLVVDYEEPFKWGDIGPNEDNIINNADYAVLSNAWNQASDVADVNADGIVNNFDLGVMLNGWGPPGDLFQIEALASELPVAPPEE